MYTELAKCAVDAALIAGKILRNGFGTTFAIENKEGINNLVTEYDNLSEKAIIDYILKHYPDHIILAEESGFTGKRNAGKICWVIDPLDGTVNFAHNLPIFSVSIAAELDGEILCGVIYHPLLNELFVGIKGKGAWLNDKPIHVSRNSDVMKSLLVTGFPYNVSKNPCHCIDLFVSVISQGIPIRRLGSAALDLAYVACGRFEGFWEIDLKPWDVAAGVLIIEEAGGKVTQFNNSKYWIENQTMLATNGLVHNQLSEMLLGCKHLKMT